MFSLRADSSCSSIVDEELDFYFKEAIFSHADLTNSSASRIAVCFEGTIDCFCFRVKLYSSKVCL